MVGVARIVPVVLIGALAACGGTDRSPGGAGTVPTTAPATAPTGGPAPRAPFVVTDDLDTPVAVAWRRGDPRAYVAEQDGRIVTVATDGRIGSEPVLEVAVSDGGEQGLLGLAFSADGTTLYTHLTDPDGDTRVDSWRMGPERADPASRRTLLVVDQPFDNHNGGSVVLGPDGLLYVGLGDGGAAGDPADNAQDPDSLLGKIVRLDPGRDDLPQPEIYMSGLRNPWRFSFDRETGAIWIGDVGQNEVEEIDTAPAGAAGINWGWDGREGTRPFEGPPVAGARDPILEIPHGPACSVIGGYVYRGSAAPDLRGRYVYGDYCDPAIRSFTVTAGRAGPRSELARVEELTSFGEDLAGELWATSGTGALVRLTGR